MPTSRKLAAIVRAHREEILGSWEASVRTLAPAAGASNPALFDRVPDLLDWLAGRLDSDEVDDAERDEFALNHAKERLEQGFDVVELVAELSALRDAVLAAWEEDPDGVEPAEIRRLSQELDHVVAVVAVEYVRRATAASASPGEAHRAAGA